MKRTFTRMAALALMLTLLLTQTGCLTTMVATRSAGQIEPGPSATAPTGTVEATASPAENEEGEEERPISLGRIEGGVYTNSYAGFGCELDSDWVFYSAEELQDLPDSVKDALEGTDMGDLMADLTVISDMKAENAEDLTTMNVQYTKMDAQTRLAYLMLSEEDIMDAMLDQSDILTSSYSQVGIEVDTMEKVEVDFLGEKHWALRTTATQYEIPCYILQIMDYTRGSYGVTLTLWSYGEDTTEDLAGLFYQVD